MDQLFLQILGGVLVLVIGAWLGVGGTTKVIVYGQRARKSGKWLIIISVAMIVGGLMLCRKADPSQWGYDLNDPHTVYGLTLISYGALLYFVGRVVAWFQKP